MDFRRAKTALLLALALTAADCGGGPDTAGPDAGPGATRDPALWPFSATSPWNTPIGSNAVYEPETSPVFDTAGSSWLNLTDWTHPIYVARPTDPVRIFFGPGGTPWGQFRVPAGAVPDPELDAHMHVISDDHLTVVETWQCVLLPDGNYFAEAFAVNNLKDEGVYDDWHGTRAYGGSAIAGLIRKGEITNGIRHALAVAVDSPAMNRNAPGGNPWVWPASSADTGNETSYGTTGNLYMGSLLAIPPSVNLDALALSPAGREIGRAMQDYGVYVVDSGGPNMIFYAEPTAAAEVPEGIENDLAILISFLQVVTNNTPSTPGGGGTPRRPAAPPFDR
ncbi:MAG: hypothetical protein HYY17_15680 [Planctomycetes bacterium]|nr:hypothetical protein [Planctomycetota bacterium]